jgi:DNA-binding SARP family transcriptional activator
MTIKFDELDRQLMILAFAHLAAERPELDAALMRIAQRCGRGGHGIEVFNDYKFMRSDDLAIANQALWLNPKNKPKAKAEKRAYKSN